MAAKIALEVLPPFLLLCLRFALVALMIVPFMPRPTVGWKPLLLLSFLLGTLHFSLMFEAVWLGIDMPSAIITTQLGVPFSCLLGSILFQDRLGRWRSFGMLVSFAGVVVIAGTPQVAHQDWELLLAILAAFAWASANVMMKRMGEVKILPLLGWLSLFCVPQLLALTLLSDGEPVQYVAVMTLRHWVALIYTVLFSTVLAYGLWYWLLGQYPISQVAPFSLLVPVFGILSYQWFYHDALTTQFLIGGVLTMLGVGVIIIRRPRIGLLERL